MGTLPTIGKLYEEQKTLSSVLNTRRHEQSQVGDRIKKVAKDASAKQVALSEAKALKAEISGLEAKLAEVDDELFRLALAVPNDTHPDVPIGPESTAVTISEHGPAPMPASPARDHVSIGRQLGLLDLEAAATVTGSSWYYLLNEGALLELALVNYAMSVAIRRGFTPVTVPDVVRSDIAYRCGFQPRDPDSDTPVSQMYHVSNVLPNASGNEAQHHPELVLAGTAEIPLAGMFADKVFLPSELPIKVVGLGRAFRAEAGARGADTRGLYRVHQFTKLELFAVTPDSQSEAMMDELRSLQTEIFEGLGLTFRCVNRTCEGMKCTLNFIPILPGSLICPQKNSVRTRTANTTWKHGCQVVAAGARSPPPQIVQITKHDGCTYVIGLQRHQMEARSLLRRKRRYCSHIP